MQLKRYESLELELVLLEEDIVTISGDNYEDDPWGEFDY